MPSRRARDAQGRRDAEHKGEHKGASRPHRDASRHDSDKPHRDAKRRSSDDAPRKKAASSRASMARVKAYECLEAVRTRDAFANDVIDKIIDGSRLDAPDRAFATRLVLGVVSMRGTLDAVLDGCMRSPRDVEPDVRDALRISLYEILYLDKSPHAAVDQGVELVRHVQPRAAGVANAVLRKAIAAKASFPFGDSATDAGAYALEQGFPAWLVARLAADLGVDRMRAFVAASNEPAPIFVGVNPICGDAEEALRAIERIGTGVHPAVVEGIEVADCYRIDNPKALADGRFKKLASEGRVLVSDAAAQAIAQLVVEAALVAAEGAPAAEERPRLTCLELCAGRGTKTILLERNLFRMTQAQFSRLVAIDNVAFKAKLLAGRAERYGLTNVESLCEDVCSLRAGAVGDVTFDLVFLDAPCSGLGTLRRHPEIRWRITPEVIAEDAKLDARLISSAAAATRPGGVLIYSTCTVTQEENAAVVRSFLETELGSQFALVPVGGRPAFATYLALGGCDAHFCAIMQRKAVR